ncbi:MAG: hypothetical protein PVG41_09235 [Desulfobacteraceae bacterium]
MLLNEVKAKALIEAGIDWICVSMDGATAEMYNKIRRGSDFERVCRNVAALDRLRKGKHPKLMIKGVVPVITCLIFEHRSWLKYNKSGFTLRCFYSFQRWCNK